MASGIRRRSRLGVDPEPRRPVLQENPALASYGGMPRPPGHPHPRSETELAYSQVTHRVAGGVLLLVAALTVWESWRPRRFPWSAGSSIVFVVFGLYLIPTSDPESWPWGPGTFMEIFTDPLVLQHKLLALVPLTYGVIGLLRSAGIDSVDPHRGPTFLSSDHAIQAAVRGEGVVLGRSALVADDLAAGRLIRPFEFSLPAGFAYYVVCPPRALQRPSVKAFRDWLIAEARSHKPGDH